MAKKKAEKLSESAIADTYEVVNGFNVPGLVSETNPFGRADVGSIVFRKDFSDSEWSQIEDCLKKIEEALKENETVVFEVVE